MNRKRRITDEELVDIVANALGRAEDESGEEFEYEDDDDDQDEFEDEDSEEFDDEDEFDEDFDDEDDSDDESEEDEEEEEEEEEMRELHHNSNPVLNHGGTAPTESMPVPSYDWQQIAKEQDTKPALVANDDYLTGNQMHAPLRRQVPSVLSGMVLNADDKPTQVLPQPTLNFDRDTLQRRGY